MQRWSRTARGEGKRIAFVPTMGALHEGHLSLIRLARQHADTVVVSIFVNPTQFAPNEDFQRYPRQPEKDLAGCAAAGANLVFMPDTDEMYPPGHSITVDESCVSRVLEGECRPGHFRGVLTIVAKLFVAVEPDLAVFGQKDAQQLWMIRRLVRDLLFPIEIIAGPTVREPDGLAMSSRNAYLSPAHRQSAAGLYQALQAAETAVGDGIRNVYQLRQIMLDRIERLADAEMEYIEIVDPETFAPLTELQHKGRALLAVKIGGTRLIDNLELQVSTA